MTLPILIIGIGELGGVFARAFLRLGYPVYPVTRGMDIRKVLASVVEPQLILVAVTEKDLTDILAELDPHFRRTVGLLQNELLPRVWEPFHLDNPTVISVWFEKKKGQDVKILKPSPVFGPKATVIADALATLEIPCELLKQEADLVFELAVKNIFVFTINICGLKVGGTTGALWTRHRKLAVQVADEVIRLQEKLTHKTFSRDHIYKKIEAGIAGDPDHKCTGRSAPHRLTRLMSLAEAAGIDIPTIRKIYSHAL